MRIVHEAYPSLVEHHLADGPHERTNACWCRPFLKTEQARTIVVHNTTHAAGSRHWPFGGELQ